MNKLKLQLMALLGFLVLVFYMKEQLNTPQGVPFFKIFEAPSKEKVMKEKSENNKIKVEQKN